jgi:hypothetical protein
VKRPDLKSGRRYRLRDGYYRGTPPGQVVVVVTPRAWKWATPQHPDDIPTAYKIADGVPAVLAEEWDAAMRTFRETGEVTDPPMFDCRLVALEREEPTCRTCNRPVRGRSDTRYCSNACRQKAYRQRKAS